MAEHLGALHAAEGPEGGQEIDGFQDVRLALGVVAQQHVKSGREVQVRPRVVAEVAEPEMCQVHGVGRGLGN